MSILTPGNSSEYDALVKYLTKKYGKPEGLFLANRAAKMIRSVNDHCTDNFRVADLSKPDEIRVYQEQKDNGCCGFIDKEFIFIKKSLFSSTQKKFRIGFNYGH